MATNTYDVGDLVRCSAIFDDVVGTDLDPTAVSVKVKTPSNAITTYVYGAGADVVKDAVGTYHIDVSITEAGMWWFRWISTGTGQSAGERAFWVTVSEF
jgi:hypothetical protein